MTTRINIINSRIKYIKLGILLLGIFFLFILLFAFLFGLQDEIQPEMVCIEFLIGILFFTCLYISPNIKNIKQLCFLVFLFCIFSSLILREYFLIYYEQPYGLAIDSYKYDLVVSPHIDSSYKEAINSIPEYFGIDDLGYTTILYVIFKIFGPNNFGRFFVILFNSILLSLSSYYIFKLAVTLNFNKQYSLLAAGIFGFFPFFPITAAVGLKEIIFCCIVCGALYYIITWMKHKTVPNLLKACVFIILSLFFRTSIFLMLFLILGACLIIKYKNRKGFIKWAIILAAISPIFANFILVAVTGISFEQVLAVTEGRNQKMGSSVNGPIIQLIAALFGPFPNFIKLAEYGLYYSSGLLFKSIFNFFTLFGFYYVIKKYLFRYYPLDIYFVFGLAFLIIGGVALDMRYACVFFPAQILLGVYGLSNIKNLTLFYWYLPFILLLIFNYNIR